MEAVEIKLKFLETFLELLYFKLKKWCQANTWYLMYYTIDNYQVINYYV